MMQFSQDAPPGPAFGFSAVEAADVHTSQMTTLQLMLDGLGPLERERIRSRNGLAMNGPWEEVNIFCLQDVENDINDFEICLQTLVRLESNTIPEVEDVRVPRMHYIRELISECLVPMCRSMPELFDVDNGVFCAAVDREWWRSRAAALLSVLYACPMLMMHSDELRAYIAQPYRLQYQVEHTQLCLSMAERYTIEFQM